MPSIMTQPMVQLVKGTGEPAVGWKVYTYQATTSILKPTYTDYAKTGMNTNPVIFDARGMANIWLDGAYKIVLKDENDVAITTQDNVTSYSGIDFSNIDIDITISDINSLNTSCVYTNVDYPIKISDRGKTIVVDATSGPLQIFLPAISTIENRWMGRIKKIDLSNNPVTVVTNLTETIDNMIGYTLNSYGDLIEVLCDGAQYFITTLYERNKELQFGTDTTITVTQQDQNKIVDANSTAGNVIVNLPSAASVASGFAVSIKRGAGGNIVTIVPNGADTIQWPYTTCNLKTDNEILTLMVDSNSTAWVIVNYYNPNPGILADTKFSYNATQPGWILMDSTLHIGNPTSGAHYSGNIYKDLYIYLWNNYSDSRCPVNGGRGVTAEADWNAASKTLQLPQVASRAIVAAGTGSGLPTWSSGDIDGIRDSILNSSNHASHNHRSADLNPILPGQWLGYGNTGFSGSGATAFGGGNYNQAFFTESQGSAASFSNVQPSTAIMAFIKI
jgi:hypothetical protein